MGTVFKKTYTKPFPPNAEIIVQNGRRIAKWRDSKGKLKKAPVTKGKDDQDRITLTASTFTAKFRDGDGVRRETATGCKDETAARRVLADLERRAELVKANVLTRAEDNAADHQAAALTIHVGNYLNHLRAKGDSDVHIEGTERLLKRLKKDCNLVGLRDISRDEIEGWLSARATETMAARTRNSYLQAVRGFCGWCVETNRLLLNPVAKIKRANEKADRRRQRRALTEDELVQLLEVTRRRPLEEARMIRRGENKGKLLARVRPETRLRLQRLGWERALIYKTLFLTGLRKKELSTLTVGQLFLDSETPSIELDAADEKSRQGNTLPILADLVCDLRQWLSTKLEAVQDAGSGDTTLVPTELPPETLLFNVPFQLVKILDRDLAAAGIPKQDGRGYTVDVHALRHSFGTHLSKGGVSPRTAQAAMRHSKIDLTMNVYTDPKLLDINEALKSLPALPLNDRNDQDVESSTGKTEISQPLAPNLAPTTDRRRHLLSSAGSMVGNEKATLTHWQMPVNVVEGTKKASLLVKSKEALRRPRRDLNPQPPDRQSGALTN
jgi:integrase